VRLGFTKLLRGILSILQETGWIESILDTAVEKFNFICSDLIITFQILTDVVLLVGNRVERIRDETTTV